MSKITHTQGFSQFLFDYAFLSRSLSRLFLLSPLFSSVFFDNNKLALAIPTYRRDMLLLLLVNWPTGRLDYPTLKLTVQLIRLADSHCHLVSRLNQQTLPSTIRSVYRLLVDPNRLANFSHQEGQYPNSLIQSDENSNQGHVGRLHIFGICTMVEIGEENLDIGRPWQTEGVLCAEK